jgi:predicted nuclease of predicted toxin-antitoxin system
VKFVVDAQLPPRLAVWLREAGYDARHVQELDLRDATDSAIRAHAARTGAIVVTKDRDFAPAGEATTRVIWVRTGNLGTRALIARMQAAMPRILAHFADGAQLVELR